jgi:hypothetical protein
MADAVTSQTLTDTDRRVVMKFTNVSDGTGESAVTKVDVSALAPSITTGAPCTSVTIEHMLYDVSGMDVKILWDANTDVVCWLATSGTSGVYDFSQFGGLTNNASTGVNGDILFTTIGASANDTYTVVLSMIKHFG